MHTTTLLRVAGLSTVAAGACYTVVGLFHPVEAVTTVTTGQWVIVHLIAMSMSFFGVLGISGAYSRQAHQIGWTGLIGYLLLIAWLVLLVPFTFTEVFLLPRLATTDPAFVESFLAVFNGRPGDLGSIKTLWDLDGFAYILGGLTFGIATFRAGVLSRWAGGVLAAGSLLAPVAAFLPEDRQALVAVPVGIALVWIGLSQIVNQPERAAARPAPNDSFKPVPSFD